MASSRSTLGAHEALEGTEALETDGRVGRPEVLVVGGGVSGCACAAGLAARGMRVTVVSSALDGVGLPGFGPDVVAGAGGWGRIKDTLGALPAALREVWLDAGIAPAIATSAGGGGFFVVDRRKLSIETKRVLERLPGLRFRQGLVVGLRVIPPDGAGRTRRVVLNTAFGEVIEGGAAVIAVGLGLGGRVAVGEDVLPGGRYGETPSDGLRVSLQEMGVELVQSSVQVGPRLAWRHIEPYAREQRAAHQAGEDGSGPRWEAVGAVSLRDALEIRYGASSWAGVCSHGGLEPTSAGAAGWDREGDMTTGEDGSGCTCLRWEEGYPAAPHLDGTLGFERMLVWKGEHGGHAPFLSPDGSATREVHLAVEGEHGGREDEWDGVPWTADRSDVTRAMASRLRHGVTGLAVANVPDDGGIATGALQAGLLWVAGRAGSAGDYLGSLASGTRVAEGVSWSVSRGSVRG